MVMDAHEAGVLVARMRMAVEATLEAACDAGRLEGVEIAGPMMEALRLAECALIVTQSNAAFEKAWREFAEMTSRHRSSTDFLCSDDKSPPPGDPK
jgi:hypothetical protein